MNIAVISVLCIILATVVNAVLVVRIAERVRRAPKPSVCTCVPAPNSRIFQLYQTPVYICPNCLLACPDE